LIETCSPFAQEKLRFIYALRIFRTTTLTPDMLFFNFSRSTRAARSAYPRFRHYLPAHIRRAFKLQHTILAPFSSAPADCNSPSVAAPTLYRSALAYSIPGLFVRGAARLTYTKGSFKGLTIVTCAPSGSLATTVSLATYDRARVSAMHSRDAQYPVALFFPSDTRLRDLIYLFIHCLRKTQIRDTNTSSLSQLAT
jgi:hypothetical protein